LYERECSIQRRRQKLIEESPSPVLSPEMRAGMEEAALQLVRESGYSNAGTVEFIVDQACESFYFLEVNARLQVEHPVTEAVTGLDLVQRQLEIAGGGQLVGSRPPQSGHAIELRVLAEDPGRGFMPSIGRILAWAEPKRPGVRVDSGFRAGSEISALYDSLLAKVIVHAPTRAQAIRRAEEALLDFHILGVRTNIAFLLDVLGHAEFRSGQFDTGWLERAMPEWTPSGEIPLELGVLAGMASGTSAAVGVRPRSWDSADGFRNVRG
jgi:acetyl/propionyl-CoA carboxylase alpha subunit